MFTEKNTTKLLLCIFGALFGCFLGERPHVLDR